MRAFRKVYEAAARTSPGGGRWGQKELEKPSAGFRLLFLGCWALSESRTPRDLSGKGTGRGPVCLLSLRSSVSLSVKGLCLEHRAEGGWEESRSAQDPAVRTQDRSQSPHSSRLPGKCRQATSLTWDF